MSMKTCILCGSKQQEGEWFFQDLCSKCSNVVHDPPYSPSKHPSIREGYIKLFIAIRKKAEEEKALGEFEDYWLYSPEMSTVWKVLAGTLFDSKVTPFKYTQG